MVVTILSIVLVPLDDILFSSEYSQLKNSGWPHLIHGCSWCEHSFLFLYKRIHILHTCYINYNIPKHGRVDRDSLQSHFLQGNLDHQLEKFCVLFEYSLSQPFSEAPRLSHWSHLNWIVGTSDFSAKFELLWTSFRLTELWS